MKKQQKITSLFRKTARKNCDESDEEIKNMEQKLVEKKLELSEAYAKLKKRKKNRNSDKENDHNNIQSPCREELAAKRKELEAIVMLTGMEVVSYEKNDHICIHYHMQHDSQFKITHGIKIHLGSDKKKISKVSMPVGFNLEAVLNDYESVMLSECLRAIYKALMAYYDRLKQFQELKESLNTHVQLFKLMDGSFIQITFPASPDCNEFERVKVTLILKYRVYDSRPKELYFVESDLPSGVSESLSKQCAVFRNKPLCEAFKKAFIKGIGPYKLVQRQGAPSAERPVQRNHYRANRPHEDDTYLPDDIDDLDDDDEE